MKVFKIMFLFFMFLGSLFFLSACNDKKDESKLDYSNFENLEFSKSEIFTRDFTAEEGQNEYYMYYYRLNCSHCNSINDESFQFINNHRCDRRIKGLKQECHINYGGVTKTYVISCLLAN